MLILRLPTMSIVMNVMLVLMVTLLYFKVDFHFSRKTLGKAELVVPLYSPSETAAQRSH